MLPKGEKLQEILKKASAQAKEEAKLAGASIYYMVNGKRIRETASGQKFEIVYDENGRREEHLYHG
jgi:hypothetical protein